MPLRGKRKRMSDSGPRLLFDSRAVLDQVHRHRDGYLTCEARVARTGLQRYRGSEVGRPDLASVTLFRPASEVFSHDAMWSMGNKPITLNHPEKMVDSKTWSKVAKGFSGNEVVRDGDFVRIPLMLTDSAAIDAYEKGEACELSVGYVTELDWSPGKTPDGTPYDGVQRDIRCNHHALVPVARGGDRLRFGDAGDTLCPNCDAELTGDPLSCPECGYTPDDAEKIGDKDFSAEERKKGAEEGWAKPDGSYPIRNNGDLSNAIRAWGRGGATASDKAWIKKRARALGAESMLPDDWSSSASDAAAGGTTEESNTMPIIRTFDGIPVSFADEISAATMDREMRKLADQVANFKGKQAKPKNGDDDDDDVTDQDEDMGDNGAAAIEAARKKVTAEDALRKSVAAKDGEIAVLRKQIADAVTTDAKVEAMAAERIETLAAAAPFLPKEFKDSGKSLADIRRVAVGQTLGDAEVKDWDDAQIIGAFKTLTKTGAAKRGGAATMADGMSRGIRETAGLVPGRNMSLADAERDAATAYGEYVKRLQDGYKTPVSAVRN